MSSETLHEAAEVLGPETIDAHRAIASIMEELEAVDWYNQRSKAVADDELRAILEHNRDEEKEHAAMVLEWLRRHDSSLDQQLRKYLFKDQPVLQIEAAGQGLDPVGNPETEGSLNIGSLLKRRNEKHGDKK